MLLRTALVILGSCMAISACFAGAAEGRGLPRALCRAVQPEPVGEKTATKVNKIGWYSSRRTVTVERLTRPDPADSWNRSEQVISTSFDVACATAVVGTNNEIECLYVAGTYETGLTTVEKWTFVYGLSELPAVQKSVLYQGDSFGPITSMELGASNAYLFFVTHEPAMACRLSTAGLSAPTVIADSTTVPALSDAGPWRLTRRVHVSEGPKYLLVDALLTNRRDVQRNDWVLTVNDSNDDGTPESVSTYTVAEWNAAGMDGHAKWID